MTHEEENREIRDMINAVKVKSCQPILDECKLSDAIVPLSYGNPISFALWNKPLCEGLIMTYDIDKTIGYIERTFNSNSQQVIVQKAKGEDGVEMIITRFFYSDENIKTMDKCMDYCGYYKAGSTINRSIIEIQYDPKFQDNISNKLRDEEKLLIHITPFYHKKKILANGFSPRFNNKFFSYPERVYFFKDSIIDECPADFLMYAQTLTGKDSKEQHDESGFTIFFLGMDAIDKNIKFFTDPNMPYAVYTKENIPPSAIVKMEDIKFKY